MHLLRQRPNSYVHPMTTASIPAVQAQAVNRRHLLDSQQRAFHVSQVIHPAVNSNMTARRRTPS
jgi:hypothetical protein